MASAATDLRPKRTSFLIPRIWPTAALAGFVFLPLGLSLAIWVQWAAGLLVLLFAAVVMALVSVSDPPPSSSSLPLTVLLVTVAVVSHWAYSQLPPFPDTVLFVMVSVPQISIPKPPFADTALSVTVKAPMFRMPRPVLPDTVLFVTVRSPSP